MLMTPTESARNTEPSGFLFPRMVPSGATTIPSTRSEPSSVPSGPTTTPFASTTVLTYRTLPSPCPCPGADPVFTPDPAPKGKDGGGGGRGSGGGGFGDNGGGFGDGGGGRTRCNCRRRDDCACCELGSPLPSPSCPAFSASRREPRKTPPSRSHLRSWQKTNGVPSVPFVLSSPMFSSGRLLGGAGVQSRPGQSRHQLPATPNFQKEQGHSASSFCPQHAAAHSSALVTSTSTGVPATSTAGGLPSANV